MKKQSQVIYDIQKRMGADGIIMQSASKMYGARFSSLVLIFGQDDRPNYKGDFLTVMDSFCKDHAATHASLVDYINRQLTIYLLSEMKD